MYCNLEYGFSNITVIVPQKASSQIKKYYFYVTVILIHVVVPNFQNLDET